jgi:hypothetical protein
MVDPIDTDRLPEVMTPRPTNTTMLIEKCNQLFHCMSGPPKAFFAIPLCPLVVDHEPYTGPSEDQVLLIAYTTVGYQAKQPRVMCEERLVECLAHVFISARLLGCDLLFWRSAPRLDELDEEGVMTTRVWCRVAIPGFDLTPYEAPWSQENRRANHRVHPGHE